MTAIAWVEILRRQLDRHVYQNDRRLTTRVDNLSNYKFLSWIILSNVNSLLQCSIGPTLNLIRKCWSYSGELSLYATTGMSCLEFWYCRTQCQQPSRMVDDKSPPDTVNATQQMGNVQHNPTLASSTSLPVIKPNLVFANGATVERPSVSRALEDTPRLNKPGQQMQSARGFFISQTPEGDPEAHLWPQQPWLTEHIRTTFNQLL